MRKLTLTIQMPLNGQGLILWSHNKFSSLEFSKSLYIGPDALVRSKNIKLCGLWGIVAQDGMRGK